MRKMMLFWASLAALASGCGSPPAEASPLAGKIGAQCSVQFRRNALGAAANVPVPPTTDAFNGAEVKVVGKLTRVSSDWIVISDGTKEYVIPKEAILLLVFEH